MKKRVINVHGRLYELREPEQQRQKKIVHNQDCHGWLNKIVNPYTIATALLLGFLSYGQIWKPRAPEPVAVQQIHSKQPKIIYNGAQKNGVQDGIIKRTFGCSPGKPVLEEKVVTKDRKECDLESIASEVYSNGDALELDEKDLWTLYGYMVNQPEESLRFLVQKWITKHAKDGTHESSIQFGIKNSRRYVGYLKFLAQEFGLPDNALIGLGMGESYFQMYKVSGAKATGPFQFIPDTAKKYNMTVMLKSTKLGKRIKHDILYAETVNPYISAHNAARLMKDLNSTFLDIDTSFAGYNSSKPYKSPRERKGGLSYKAYLNYLGKELYGVLTMMKNAKNPKTVRHCKLQIGYILENLNYPPKAYAILETTKDKNPDYYNSPPVNIVRFDTYKHQPKMHKVQPKQTLNQICRQYGVAIQELKARNSLKGNALRAGSSLIIPETKQDIINKICKQYSLSITDFPHYNNHIYYAQVLPEQMTVVIPSQQH